MFIIHYNSIQFLHGLVAGVYAKQLVAFINYIDAFCKKPVAKQSSISTLQIHVYKYIYMCVWICLSLVSSLRLWFSNRGQRCCSLWTASRSRWSICGWEKHLWTLRTSIRSLLPVLVSDRRSNHTHTHIYICIYTYVYIYIYIHVCV